MKSLYLGLLASLTLIACDQNEGVKFDILIKDANIVDTQTGDILQNHLNNLFQKHRQFLERDRLHL